MHALVHATHNDGDDFGESAWEAVAHNGPVRTRDGPVPWEWLAERIIGRLGPRADHGRVQ